MMFVSLSMCLIMCVLCVYIYCCVLLTVVFVFFSEHSIVTARASVMIYDDVSKKWVPSGSSQGLSKVHIYHHAVNNTFRVVGRKLNDHEVRK